MTVSLLSWLRSVVSYSFQRTSKIQLTFLYRIDVRKRILDELRGEPHGDWLGVLFLAKTSERENGLVGIDQSSRECQAQNMKCR